MSGRPVSAATAAAARPGTQLEPARPADRRPRCAATWSRSAACCGRAASAAPTWRCARFAAFLAETAPEVTCARRRSPAATSRTTSPGWPPGPGRTRPGVTTGDHRAPARHAADVLRPDRRMGLGRGPAAGADVPRRPAPPGPPAAQGPRRRRRREAAARRPGRPAGCSSGSPSRCCCAPGCGSASSPRCAADAVVLIGAAPWLHVPVGKLREDRYLPLHPQPGHPDRRLPRRARPARAPAAAAPGERPRRWTGTPSPGSSTRPAPPPGCRHIHPHQLRHTLATQAINRGMSLEAIAAMLGHRSLDMTLRYAKIANRTVADEYFAVTEQGRRPLRPSPPAARRRHRTEDGPAAPRAPPPARQRLLHPPARARLRLRVHLRDLHASSRPASSSGPPCKPNTTTPPPRTKTTAPTSSTSSSPASTEGEAS